VGKNPGAGEGVIPTGSNKPVNNHLNKILKTIQKHIPLVQLAYFNLQKDQSLIVKLKSGKFFEILRFSENYAI
jgi:hypothetical protein